LIPLVLPLSGEERRRAREDLQGRGRSFIAGAHRDVPISNIDSLLKRYTFFNKTLML